MFMIKGAAEIPTITKPDRNFLGRERNLPTPVVHPLYTRCTPVVHLLHQLQEMVPSEL